MGTSSNTDASRMLLSIRIIADFMDEASWSYLSQTQGDQPCFASFRFYSAAEPLRNDILYLLTEETEETFPVNQYSYVTVGNLAGEAPHIRAVHHPAAEVANLILQIFQRFRDFEYTLNCIVRSGGTLTDLCRAGEDFFHNPMFIHDSMFALTGLPRDIASSTQFDRNEESGVIHIPLNRIDEFRYDPEYIKTLSDHQAKIWDNRAYPNGFRSLYVNLWDGEYYYGRLLINERQTALKPGQFRAADCFAEYAVMILQRDAESMQHSYGSFEDTLIGLASGSEVSASDTSALLSILQWEQTDRYIFIRMKNRDNSFPITPVSAVRSILSRELKDYVSFFYEKELCVLLNITKSKFTPGDINQRLAAPIRDNYLIGGVSNPFNGIGLLQAAFRQANAALRYAALPDSGIWLVPFERCAIHFVEYCATLAMPAELLAAPQILKLRAYDQEHGTEYYRTLKAWLFHERRIPETAAALIVHRTTLTYRLGKLKELIPMDLDDDLLRMYLIFSYHLLDQVHI